MDAKNFIHQLEVLIKANSLKEAFSLYKNHNFNNLIDSNFHFHLATLLEQGNFINEAIKEYNLSIRDDKNQINAHLRLSEIFLDRGELSLAADQLNEAISKGHHDKNIFLKLGKIYEQKDEKGSAIEIYKFAYEKTQDNHFLSLINNLIKEKQKPLFKDTAKEIPEVNHLIKFLALFSGRENVYARQWVKKNGETGYSPIYEPLTPKLVKEHLMGNITLGIYPLRLDNTVNFIALDIDINKRMLEKANNDPSMMELLINLVHETACKIIQLGKNNNIPIYLEDSGFKGRHCWIFLEHSLDAQIAKSFAEILIKNIDIPMGVNVEIFPKQITHSEKMLGNLIKLPLGIHRKSGRRALFINEDGTPIFDQLQFLDNIQKVNKAALFNAGEALKKNIPKETKSSFTETELLDSPIIQPATAEPIRLEFSYKIEEDPIIKYLFSNCETLSAIYNKAAKEHELNHNEQIVLIYSIGCLEEGHKKVNAIFDKCLNIDDALYQKNPQRGNPISCPKIRQRIPYITKAVNCNCYFPPEAGSYPHPLLHLKNMPKSIEYETTESWHINYLVSEYLKAQKELSNINMLLEKLEKALNDIFEQAGIDSLNTPFGKLKREPSGDKFKFILEI